MHHVRRVLCHAGNPLGLEFTVGSECPTPNPKSCGVGVHPEGHATTTEYLIFG